MLIIKGGKYITQIGGFPCDGTKESQGVKRRLSIMTAQYVNIVFDMLIYS